MERPGFVRRVGETIKENPAEVMWGALAVAALTYEVRARKDQLLSDAANRHQGIAAMGTFILGTHFVRLWDRIGHPELDLMKQAGKQAAALHLGRGFGDAS